MSLRALASSLVATVCLLALPAVAHADDAAATERQYKNRRNLGIAGMSMGYGGPVIMLGGGALAVGGLAGLAANGLNGSSTTGSANSAAGGIALVVVGGASTFVGTPLLAAGTLKGAKTIRQNGGTVRRTAGWISLGGVGLQYLGLLGGGSGGGLTSVALGWGTAMVAGTIQHGKNGTEFARLAAVPVEPKRVQLALTPTANGAVLHGSF